MSSTPGALQRFHCGSTVQSAQKPILRQRLVGEAAADRAFRHDDDRLLDALVVQLVERDEHQRAALAGGRRRLDQQILLAALVIGALLHRRACRARWPWLRRPLRPIALRQREAAWQGMRRSGFVGHQIAFDICLVQAP